MANIATGEFAAAVSNAGGLGLIGAGGMNTDMLRENIRKCRTLTDKPLCCSLLCLYQSTAPAKPRPKARKNQLSAFVKASALC